MNSHFLRAIRPAFVLCAAISFANCSSLAVAQDQAVIVSGEQGVAMHSALTRAYQDEGFSGAVIFEQGGEVLLSAAYGLANREEGAPFTSETVAQIGSISKQFTATAALVLAHDGALDLHTPISTYLPEAALPGGNATLHQLMTHTSGFTRNCGTDDFEVMSQSRLIGECLALPLAFEPESQSLYSNMGFSVVAAVVERVSGRTLEDFLQERIFLPNGMTRTGYMFDGPQDFARGYLDDEPQPNMADRIAAIAPDYWVLKGNGGIQSTLSDMRQWHRVLLGQGSLPPEVIEPLLTPHAHHQGNQWVGYGWYLRQDDDSTVFEVAHSGSDGIFFSYFWLDPTTETFFYIVGNSGEGVTVRAIQAILPIFRDTERN